MWSVTRYVLILLRRNRLFVPFLLGVPLMFLLAVVSGSWTFEDAARIQVDITAFGLHVGGSVVTLLWGSQLFSVDPGENPSLEFEAVVPVSGAHWILGRFFGLAAHLALACLVFFTLWCFLFARSSSVLFTREIGWMFLAQYLGWLSLGGLCALMGVLFRRNFALLAGFAFWIIGLMAPLVAASETDRRWLQVLADIWDFQRFNVVSYEPVSLLSCFHTILWSLGLVIVFLSLACLNIGRHRLFAPGRDIF